MSISMGEALDKLKVDMTGLDMIEEEKEEPTALIHFDAARRELALAKNVDEVKQIRDQAEALRQYIRQQGASLEMQNHCAEIKLRAERRVGEMLGEQVTAGNPQLLHDETIRLADLGITRIQSHRWQLEASVPDEVFERHIAEIKARPLGELTSIGLLRLASTLKMPDSGEWLPLPNKKYRTLVIDPPWPIEKVFMEERTPENPIDYPTKSIEEISLLDISSLISEDGAHIYLWTTQKHLPSAIEILNCWGLRYFFTIVWHKNRGRQLAGLPQYNCEFVLFSRTNGLKFLDTKNFATCFCADAKEHSRKPDEFYELIRRVSPAPRLDMFSREKREGFEQYGNEVDKYSEH